ncbi:MAG: acetyl-CoA carboxylase biotin carboxyl carrier protein [Streptococcus sp.]|nr:acetyl-CoA carboxylase biotin carboxyl carrier protein [Streptococcus sp.]
MNISEIKDLMAQFDKSSLKEFSYRNTTDELCFSKNSAPISQSPVSVETTVVSEPKATVPVSETVSSETTHESVVVAEGDVVESPLVGVAYLASGPDKPAFVSVGDTVKKGQTLLIIEAMKVMNEVPSPKDGIVTEILVSNEEVVEFGKGLVRIK